VHAVQKVAQELLRVPLACTRAHPSSLTAQEPAWLSLSFSKSKHKHKEPPASPKRGYNSCQEPKAWSPDVTNLAGLPKAFKG